MRNRLITSLFLVLLLGAVPLSAMAEATITIVNMDGPNEGFNDPTPAKPVGKNIGKTVGAQRLIAFQFAADIWGATLDSTVEIRIQASFDALSCTANSAVLGSAGPIQVARDFDNAQFTDTWYTIAQANKLAQEDLAPGPAGTSADDIRARFNSNLGAANCLAGSGWYYGLDGKEGNGIDLVAVLLHEFAHGLGFISLVDERSGNNFFTSTDIFSRHLKDAITGKTWNQLNNVERARSASNPRGVSWNGSTVNSLVPIVLALGTPTLTVSSPTTIAGEYDVGTAEFGPALTVGGVTGQVVQAFDAGSRTSTTTDGCTAPFTNASSVSGKVALVDRGTCTFVTKVKNAQAAGAIAVIVADNVEGEPPAGMGGSDPSITIPSVRITLGDGEIIKANLAAGVTATLRLDDKRRAGANAAGEALVWSPNPIQPGSSISHWDVIASPNQLMEPSINRDLTHSVNAPEDLTFPLFVDLGW